MDRGPNCARRPEKSWGLSELIRQRELAREPGLRKLLSNAVLKVSRREWRTWRITWTEYLLEKFRDTKFLQEIDIDSIRQKCCAISPDDFGDSLGSLYHPRLHDDDPDLEALRSIPLFQMKEFEDVLKQLRNVRAIDDTGLCAEMLKVGSQLMKSQFLRSFNSILRIGECEDAWYEAIFPMLPKDGDLSEISNWWPITTLSILYKLFARIVYIRISPGLFVRQSNDQHAFTANIRIEDTLLYTEVAIDYTLEFNEPLWVMGMDMRKAFGIIDYSAIFHALRDKGLPEGYIALLQLLYRNQSEPVNGGRSFAIRRGIGHGDILSAIISYCVLDVAFENSKS